MENSIVKYSIIKDALYTLVDIKSYVDIDVDDLHHEMYNMADRYIYTHDCKAVLNEFDVFDAIDVVKGYEKDVFGQASTDVSSPYKLANMLYYIVGETMLNDFWDWLETTHDIARPEKVGDIENIGDLAQDYYDVAINNWARFETRIADAMFAWC